MTQSHNFISVIIPTFNRVNSLRTAIDSILVQNFDRAAYEIIIVDDSSSDETADFLNQQKEKYSHIKPYRNQHNLGAAGTRNQGARLAGGTILAFIDDDCIADSNWLNEINWGFSSYPRLMGVEGKTVKTNTELENPMTHAVENLHGKLFLSCNIAYAKDIFLKLNGFDVHYRGGLSISNEDFDLGFRIREKGRILFNQRMIVYHPPRNLSFLLKIKYTPKRTLYEIRNEFLFYNKFPQAYQEVKFHKKISGTLIYLTIKYLVVNLRKKRVYLLKTPIKYIQFGILKLIEQIFYIINLVVFFLFDFKKQKGLIDG